MSSKPAYEELEQRIKELERALHKGTQVLEALKKSEERHRLVLEATEYGVWDWDARTGKVYFSPGYCSMIGYKPNELEPEYETWANLLHPDDRAYAEGVVREHLEGKTDGFEIEVRLKTKSGDWKWVLSRGKVVERGDNREPLRVIGIHEDISQRKKVEQELKMARSVIDRASFGCFWISSDSRIIYINDQACQSLGYSREELLSMSIQDIDRGFPPEVWHELWKRLLTSRVQTFETIHLRKDGTGFPVEITVNCVEFDGEEYSCAYVRDLTDHKLAERAVRENEERLRQAIRVSSIGIFDHDHLTDIIYWSPRQREIYGWGPDEPVTLQGFLDVVYPEDLERIKMAVQRAHDPANDGFWDVEYRIIHRDGNVRWLTARSQTFFDGTGSERRPIRTVGALRDITGEKQSEGEREKLQAQLIQAQKMESVGRLAGGVAHDFNNMLTVILGHADLALHRLDPVSPLRTDLLRIEEAAQRSADLTRRLLAFARKQTIVPKVLDLNDTMEGMLEMLRRLIGENIDTAWAPGRGLWPVKIDPAQVNQILANLFVNARDAIVDDGKVTIETGNVEFDQAYCAEHTGFIPGRFVMLAVSDDGRGMDEETHAHIFEPFFTTKGVGKGTGLGMATVYGIVKQNEGFINVYSEVCKGTTIKIYLPRYAAEAAPVCAEDPVPPAEGGTETILLVEDDSMVLELNKTLLEKLGYTVLPASVPGEAIRLAEEHREKIRLLITDVVMPEMNGRELSNRLTTLLPDLKSLFLSGYTANVIAHRGVLEEGVHFLQKPVSRNNLALKVRQVLESK